MDSGSNYHVTPNSETLDQVHSVGKAHLLTCTGEKASVTGIGSVFLPYSKLHLNDVLIVPSATKNLLSVQKLANDNQVKLLSLILSVL